MAARRVRACLEEVIDSDVVTAAVDQCRRTLKDGATTPMADRMLKMLEYLSPFGVTQPMLETRLGNKVSAMSENQYAQIYRIYKSLKDGVGRVEDYFKPEVTKPEFKPASEAPANAPEAPEDVPDDFKPLKMAGAAPEPTKPAESAPVNNLKMLRQALQSRKIPENVLLDFLSVTGATDGSAGSLEELAISNGKLIADIIEQWVEFSMKLIEHRDSKKRGAK